MLALKNRGLKLRAFKVGPDFIDPMFHNAALGIPSKNLDLFFTDPATLRALFELGNDSDLSIVEGVMGLYDGWSPESDDGSTYRVAVALGSPIALVVDAAGMGRSALAEIRGFLETDTERAIKGVILNRIPPSYFGVIKPIIERELDVKVFGYFPKDEDLTLESRYLGLKLPGEIERLRERVERAARIIERSVDLDAILQTVQKTADERRAAPNVETPQVSFPTQETRSRIAIARDAAFCFYYEDNLRLLKEFGAQLVEFSPLKDEALPPDVDGLILGGGYPELYAGQLADNESMLKSIRAAWWTGAPCLAECGGFMYLHERIALRDGSERRWLGVLPGFCRFVGKLVRFGYAAISEPDPVFFTGESRKIAAHEFHYFDSDDPGQDALAVKRSGKTWRACHVTENRWLGFPHLYYPSNPEFPKTFVDKCAEFRARREHF